MLLTVGPFAVETAWMLQAGASVSDGLFGEVIVPLAIHVALVLLMPALVFVVMPALAAVVVLVAVPLVVAGVLVRAVVPGFMSVLRSAPASQRPVNPPHE